MGYSCGLPTTGGALCWGGVGGYFPPFPLEDSLVPNSAIPLRVPGGRHFVEITVGGLGACALDSERAAYCWGANQMGEVGDGSYLAKRGPAAVVGGHRWKMIAAGGTHVCGIALDDRTYCWGNQFRGALGNGLRDGSNPQPVEVLGGLTFASVYAGPARSCGLTADGDAYCWGVNDYGQLGDGEPPEPGKHSAAPSRVVGGLRFASLGVGGTACGVTHDALAYCWGWNPYGQLGDGTTVNSSSPVRVAGNLRWASLSVGNAHSCGLTTDGAAYCWGSNVRGQFGNGSTEDASTPQLIAGAGTYVALATGGNHTCGLTAAGTARCWGQNNYGQVGDGTAGSDRLWPTQVAAYK
ncbi:MAG: RCC1 domain-containing protein [Gemmatimonadaceae bacterium]